MGTLIERISEILDESFPGCKIDIGPRPGGYVGGFLVSDVFEEKDMEERQKLLWTLLRNRLSQDDIAKITAIFTQTENENEILLEESEAV